MDVTVHDQVCAVTVQDWLVRLAEALNLCNIRGDVSTDS